MNVHDIVPKNRSVTYDDNTGMITRVTQDYGFATIEADYTREDTEPYDIISVSFDVV